MRGEGVSFRKQHAMGNYIVDFVSIKKKLIIELDHTSYGRITRTDRIRRRTNPIFGIAGVSGGRLFESSGGKGTEWSCPDYRDGIGDIK